MSKMLRIYDQSSLLVCIDFGGENFEMYMPESFYIDGTLFEYIYVQANCNLVLL